MPSRARVQARLTTTTPPHQRSDGLSLGASTDAPGARNLTSFSPPSPQLAAETYRRVFSRREWMEPNYEKAPASRMRSSSPLSTSRPLDRVGPSPQGSPASTWHIPCPSLRTAVNSTMEGSDENTDEGGRSGRGECCAAVARRR